MAETITLKPSTRHLLQRCGFRRPLAAAHQSQLGFRRWHNYADLTPTEMSGQRNISLGVVDVCKEEIRDQLMIILIGAVSFSWCEDISDALEQLNRDELRFLMLLSALRFRNAQMSSLLSACLWVEDGYRTYRIEKDLAISQTDLLEAITFAQVLQDCGYTSVPQELFDYMQYLYLVYKERMNEELIKAARNGDLGSVESLISEGANPNFRDRIGWPTLCRAAEGSHLDVVEALIAGGADINSRGRLGITPLHTAAGNGDTHTVKALIARGADPNTKNESGSTPLHMAASGGHLDVVHLLIDLGAEPNCRNLLGSTPLLMAVAKGHLEVVQTLIERGANSIDGDTPLSVELSIPPFC